MDVEYVVLEVDWHEEARIVVQKQQKLDRSPWGP